MLKDEREVVITDVRIPMGSLVVLLVKLAIASIPALLILCVIGFLVVLLLAMVGIGFAGPSMI